MAPTSAATIIGDILRDRKVLSVETLAKRSGFAVRTCEQIVRSIPGGSVTAGRASIIPRTRPTVYIAAPYRADTPEQIEANVVRARNLARIAHHEGLAPIYVHDWIALDVFGPDEGEWRDAGLDTACVLAASCDRIWAVTLPDGTLSHGVGLEVEAWRRAHPNQPIHTI
jgi:hypothetical protein